MYYEVEIDDYEALELIDSDTINQYAAENYSSDLLDLMDHGEILDWVNSNVSEEDIQDSFALVDTRKPHIIITDALAQLMSESESRLQRRDADILRLTQLLQEKTDELRRANEKHSQQPGTPTDSSEGVSGGDSEGS